MNYPIIFANVGKQTVFEATFSNYIKMHLYARKFQKSTSGHPSTVYDYIKRIDYVCKIEHTDWHGLIQRIDSVLLQYEECGSEEQLGAKLHNAVRSALRQFHAFSKRFV